MVLDVRELEQKLKRTNGEGQGKRKLQGSDIANKHYPLILDGPWEGRNLKGRRKCGHGVELKLNLSAPGRWQKSLTEQLPLETELLRVPLEKPDSRRGTDPGNPFFVGYFPTPPPSNSSGYKV